MNRPPDCPQPDCERDLTVNFKSPLKLRQDLEASCRRLELLIGVLETNASESKWGLGQECSKAAGELRQLLRDNEIPDDYRVAVIGRFKAGKSSFVNELLGRKLAGEDTSPETAAVTTFTQGERVQAKIKLVDKKMWDELKRLHEKDPSDPDAHRVANWMKFSGRDRGGQPLSHPTAAPSDETVGPTLAADSIRERATKYIERFTLKNGATGWHFPRIFVKEQIAGATEAWLVDPYLAKPHQRRNLKEFINTVLSSAKLKTLNIVTGHDDPAPAVQDNDFFDQLDKGLYEQTGTRICLFRDPEAHDRFAIFDNGIVFKLGRGLDIYKPATGIASANPELRRVRECEIDIFGIPPEQP